ncbi:uncharacterized protein LOC113467831 [Diaphorina citri]|uniref:lysozyme n=1 Tax=Diaphorina citri TaxID=121845 RepID=A0A3Q0IZD8_DIACI|nr:uncharacterized protein LOC113467831 [Diaphorina citri]KAI5706028.1 hypothetical protein M8J75_004166 [Diaphorina citri]
MVRYELFVVVVAIAASLLLIQAYSRCTNDAVCSGKTVENYMIKFAQDCDADGQIDCRDYAAIHRLGGYGCNAPLDATYLARFNKCLNDVAQLNG